MGLELEIRLGAFSPLRKELEAGRLDAMTGMFYSEERARRVDFSNPYSIVHHAIFIRQGTTGIQSEKDLANKSVIVERGDILHDYMLAHVPTARLVLVDKVSDGLRLLAAGQHDCLLTGKMQGLFLSKTFNLTNIITVGPPILDTQYCFAVRKRATAGRWRTLTRGWRS